MDDLLSVIAELGLELHPDRISTVASKIETLGSVEQFALTRSSFGPNADKELVGRLDRAWRNSKGTSPSDVGIRSPGSVCGGGPEREPRGRGIGMDRPLDGSGSGQAHRAGAL